MKLKKRILKKTTDRAWRLTSQYKQIVFNTAICLSLPLAVQAAEKNISYTYDVLGRVIAVDDSVNGKREYSLDAVGNRTHISVEGQSPGATPTPTPLPALGAPSNLKLSGPFGYGGVGYLAEWHAAPGAAYYILRIENSTDVIVTNNGSQMSYSSNHRPIAIRAMNDDATGCRS